MNILNGKGTRQLKKIIKDLHLSDYDSEKVNTELAKTKAPKAKASTGEQLAKAHEAKKEKFRIRAVNKDGEWSYYKEKLIQVEDENRLNLNRYHKKIELVRIYNDVADIPKELLSSFDRNTLAHYNERFEIKTEEASDYSALEGKYLDTGELFDATERSFSNIGRDLLVIRFLDKNAEKVEFIFSDGSKVERPLEETLKYIAAICDDEDVTEIKDEALSRAISLSQKELKYLLES